MTHARLAVLVTTGALLLPATASAQVHAADVGVACDPGDLIAKVAAANTGGDPVLSLASYCVYEFGVGDANGDAIPQITLPAGITIHGNNATLLRSTTAATDFRLLEVAVGGQLTADNLTVMNGRASGNGGGGVRVTGAGSTLTTTDVSFLGNAAGEGAGGAVLGETDTITSLTGGSVRDNRAQIGGGVDSETGAVGSTTLTSVTVSGNRATAVGGGVATLNGGNINISGSTISNNTSHFAAGGILATGGVGNLMIDGGSVISGNSVSNFGGGGLSVTLPASITDSTISGNLVNGVNAPGAIPRGGGIASASPSLTLDNTKITGNRMVNVSSLGGGLAVVGGTANVTNGSQITGNVAAGANSLGGGLYSDTAMGPSTVNVNGSLIDRNTVSGTGSVAGGIYNNGATVSLTNASVQNNKAPAAPAPGGIWTTVVIVPVSTTIAANSPTNCLLSPAAVTGCAN
ncbi:hypothetical protein [Streptomyces sp. NPDC086787]|uniref:hypothetical protein n=1 Tax=Streptomyces sp. NPDC086787 TaxID=3365759 RepID=UPI00380CC2D9